MAIPTFIREKCLKKCLNSLTNKNYRKVIVGDDSKISKEKQRIYQHYSEKIKNFEVIDMEFDKGLSAKRNRILEKCDTKYFLLIDDDHTVHNIKPLFNILENNLRIGAVSGFGIENNQIVKAGANNLYEKGSYLVKDIKEIECDTVNGHLYFYFDQIPNSALMRTELLKENRWDENYKIGYEHLDFYYYHYKNTNWKFAITPEVFLVIILTMIHKSTKMKDILIKK